MSRAERSGRETPVAADSVSLPARESADPRISNAAVADRLQRLFGGPGLAELRARLRGRYQRGETRDAFTLTRLGARERRALEGLLGRAVRPADSMRLSTTELDVAIRRAGLASSLRSALELLDGPIRELTAERAAAREAWSALLCGIAEPRLAALLSCPAGAGLLKRLAERDPARARGYVDQSLRVLGRLPARGIPLARLAAETLGDSHALDAGRPAATLVLRACGTRKLETDTTTGFDPFERRREQWAQLGVTVNELAMPALCLNLGPAELGEPTHVSLRKLLRTPLHWDVSSRQVFVCENPSIVAIAADGLGPAAAPLVSTDGMPGAAQQTLLRQLAASGARLRYHGDFDWAGLAIGNFVMRTFGAEPWAFTAADYLSACARAHGADDPYTPLSSAPIEALWDATLSAAMAERGIAVHEEAVVERLLQDLAK